MTLLWGALLFGAGIALMLASVEGLVKTVVGRAAALGISGLALGALSTSLDPESTGTGIAAAFKGLPEVAIGAHVGSVIFIATLALGVLAIVHPFEVEVPRLFLFGIAASTALSVAVLISGELDRVRGLLLLITFGVLVRGAIKELRSSRVLAAAASVGAEPTDSDEVVREAQTPSRTSLFVGHVGVAVAGLVVGSELLIEGTKRLLEGLGWSATIFGSIIVAIALSLEEGFLELVPAHRGHPEISVGNVVGTIPFLLGGSLGLIGLIRPIAFGGSLCSFHALALGVAGVCCLWALTRRQTGRREGSVLIVVYGLYLAGTLVFG